MSGVSINFGYSVCYWEDTPSLSHLTPYMHVHICIFLIIIVITDAIDFHAPVKLGHIIHLTGRVTFTSSRSMEIEVIVDAKDYLAGKVSRCVI